MLISYYSFLICANSLWQEYSNIYNKYGFESSFVTIVTYILRDFGWLPIWSVAKSSFILLGSLLKLYSTKGSSPIWRVIEIVLGQTSMCTRALFFSLLLTKELQKMGLTFGALTLWMLPPIILWVPPSVLFFDLVSCLLLGGEIRWGEKWYHYLKCNSFYACLN